MSTSPAVHTNRLAREKSPYLLQHQHNPVDWFPWGDEAFAKARAENSLRFFAPRLQTIPQAMPCLLSALAFSLEAPRRIVI